MESVLVEIDTSDYLLEFSGSSENDVSFAKKFWHSGSLLPYVESNLQSERLTQRLRVAPFPGHGR
jgi:Cilia- and flagella-associated protein HOATZ-like